MEVWKRDTQEERFCFISITLLYFGLAIIMLYAESDDIKGFPFLTCRPILLLLCKIIILCFIDNLISFICFHSMFSQACTVKSDFARQES